jgi:hypothetical protein
LELKADIWKPFDVRPSIAVLSANEEASASVSRVLRIVSNLEEPVVLTGATSANESLKLELRTIEPGKRFELEVTAGPPFAHPSKFASIKVATSSAIEPEIELKAQIVVQPAVAVLPKQITVPRERADSASSSIVTIRNNGTELLEVSGATVNMPGVEVHVQETQPNKLFRVTVTFPASFELKPDDDIAVTVNTNHPKYSVIRVPVVRSQRSTSRAKAVEESDSSSEGHTDEAHVAEALPEQ